MNQQIQISAYLSRRSPQFPPLSVSTLPRVTVAGNASVKCLHRRMHKCTRVDGVDRKAWRQCIHRRRNVINGEPQRMRKAATKKAATKKDKKEQRKTKQNTTTTQREWTTKRKKKTQNAFIFIHIPWPSPGHAVFEFKFDGAERSRPLGENCRNRVRIAATG